MLHLFVPQMISKAVRAFKKSQPAWSCESCNTVLWIGMRGITMHDPKKLQSFHISCFRNTVRIFRPKNNLSSQGLPNKRTEGLGDYSNGKNMMMDLSHYSIEETTFTSKVTQIRTPDKNKGKLKDHLKDDCKGELCS